MSVKLLILFLFVVVINCGKSNEISFKQEQGKVLYFNRKYLQKLTMLTSRESRRSPYLTSVNFTLIVPLGNNVTWRIEVSSAKLSSFPLILDFNCDAMHKPGWLRDILSTTSNLLSQRCPVPPGDYYIRKLTIPPKNFPMEFATVDYMIRISSFVASTKEKIMETVIALKYSKG